MDLSIIVPAYNEEKRLGETLEKVHGFFRGKNYEHEIIVIDDGSSDDTAGVAYNSEPAKRSVLQVVSNSVNRGKGFSIREGFKKASGDLILFTDADLSTPIEEMQKLEAAINNSADIAIGSRSLRGSKIRVRQPLYRIFMGKTFNLLVQGIVMRGLIDTQCGFKLYKRECIKDILPDLRVDGFSFDVELLYLARRKGYKIKEVPVVWVNSRESKVRSVRDSAKMLFDLVNIRLIHG